MQLSACGIDCATCPSLNKDCKGCLIENGNVFWTKSDKSSFSVCPIKACCNKKGYVNCGECENLPCEIYKSLKGSNDTLAEEQKKKCIKNLLLKCHISEE